jgi:hypothetical protein
MKNRMMLLLTFLAAFMLMTPVMAAPPEEGQAATEGTSEGAMTDGTSDETSTGAMADTEGTATEDTGDSEEATPSEIEDDEEALSVVEELVNAAKGGQWSLVVAFVIMLLVYVVKRFGLKDKLPSKAVPWVAAGTSMAGYVAAALMVDGAGILDAVLGGLATGAAAVGLWEMVFKHFLGAKQQEAPAES